MTIKTKNKEIQKKKSIFKKNNKPTINNQQIIKNNIIKSCDLVFLRKDNTAYFVDTNGKSLHSCSQKLFEQNKHLNLNKFTLNQPKTTKIKN